MGVYIFQNPKTGTIKEVFQKISEEHIFVDEKGLKWDRIFTIPHASIDTQIDAFSERDFSEKMKKKKGTVGDLMDASKEASEKRQSIAGKDPTKEKYFKNWSKKRMGRKHPKSEE